MQESVDGIIFFRFCFLIKELYIFFIYVKEYKLENIVSLYEVCEYKFVQEEVLIIELYFFLFCIYLNWGFSFYFYRYGLIIN